MKESTITKGEQSRACWRPITKGEQSRACWRPITKKELSRAYAPGLTPKAALNRLAYWINSCQPLVRALGRTGYVRRQRKLTPQQLRLIYRYLGEP